MTQPQTFGLYPNYGLPKTPRYSEESYQDNEITTMDMAILRARNVNVDAPLRARWNPEEKQQKPIKKQSQTLAPAPNEFRRGRFASRRRKSAFWHFCCVLIGGS